jgi:hypothetical protein
MRAQLLPSVVMLLNVRPSQRQPGDDESGRAEENRSLLPRVRSRKLMQPPEGDAFIRHLDS